MDRLGFIGLGNMGAPMAKNLLEKFGALKVYNRSRGICEKFARMGAEPAADAGELARGTDVIFLSLPGPAEVKEVMEILLENGRSGQRIVDFSTVDPATSRTLSRKAQKMGIFYVDVPVSGGGAGAARAALSLMIGAGEGEMREAGLMPYLETVGNVFHFIGSRGGGSAIKLINNYMSFTAQVINGEAILMADHLGIPLDIFYDVVTTSSGSNNILKAKMEKVKNRDLSPGFALDLVMKDLELARGLCQDCKILNFTLNTAIQFYRTAQQLGYGDKDSSGVIHMIRGLIPAPDAEENTGEE